MFSINCTSIVHHILNFCLNHSNSQNNNLRTIVILVAQEKQIHFGFKASAKLISAKWDSNPRPSDYKSDSLTIWPQTAPIHWKWMRTKVPKNLKKKKKKTIMHKSTIKVGYFSCATVYYAHCSTSKHLIIVNQQILVCYSHKAFIWLHKTWNILTFL